MYVAQTPEDFAQTVISRSKKYVAMEPNIKNSEETVETYRYEITELFQTAKDQHLTIPEKFIMGDDGIRTYFILLAKSTPYILKLRDVLTSLLTNEFADLIVKDSDTAASDAVTQSAKTVSPVVTTLTPVKSASVPKPTSSRPAKKTPKKTTNISTASIISTNEVLGDELPNALHTFTLKKADRNKLMINFDIDPQRKHYLKAWDLCKKYLGYLGGLPEKIQEAKQETESRMKKVESYKTADFKNIEANHHLYDRIAKILIYLREQFPLISE